jgi:hypothetical protein
LCLTTIIVLGQSDCDLFILFGMKVIAHSILLTNLEIM